MTDTPQTEMVRVRAAGQAIIGSYPTPPGQHPNFVQPENFVSVDGEVR